jgi:hypothetical protein
VIILILCAKSLRQPLTANPASLIASWRAFPVVTALGPVQTVTDRSFQSGYWLVAEFYQTNAKIVIKGVCL